LGTFAQTSLQLKVQVRNLLTTLTSEFKRLGAQRVPPEKINPALFGHRPNLFFDMTEKKSSANSVIMSEEVGYSEYTVTACLGQMNEISQ